MTQLLPVRPTHKGVFIDIIDRDVSKKDLGNGKVLHLLTDDGFGPDTPRSPMAARHPGIRPRWARVLSIGPEVQAIKPGHLVLCDTLKWGRRIPLGRRGLEIVYFWRISEDDILLIDDREDHEAFMSEARSNLSQIEFSIGRL